MPSPGFQYGYEAPTGRLPADVMAMAVTINVVGVLLVVLAEHARGAAG